MKKLNKTKPVKKKLHVRTGDFVKVIAGNEKGKSGEILSVDLVKERAVVDGLNLRTRHLKPTANNPEGSLEEFSAPIHISNLMRINPETNEPARQGRTLNEETGKLERYFKAKKANVAQADAENE